FCSTALTAVAVLLSTWPGLEVGEPAPVGIPALIAAIRQHKQIFTAILAVAIGACALVSMKNKPGPFRRVIVPVALIGLNFFSLATISKNVLPPSSQFNVTPPPLVELLKQRDGRIMAIGDHFMVPHVNMLYGLNDCRVLNPLKPGRKAR